MPALTPFEYDVLEAVESHRWYPAQTIAAAVHNTIPTTLSVLRGLQRFGLVDRYQSRSLRQETWALSPAGQRVVLERRARNLERLEMTA